MHILKAEVPGPVVGKLVSKVRATARILYVIYATLTVIEIVLLLFGGMPLFDSILNAFETAGTGGFAIKIRVLRLIIVHILMLSLLFL